MPLGGFICDALDAPIAVPDCLACARSGALPGCHQTAPVIAGIIRGLRPDDPAVALTPYPPQGGSGVPGWSGFGLTVTTLISCTRKARLMRDTTYWLKPAHSYWAYRGQLMHGVAAQYADEADQVIAEKRFAMMVNTHAGQLVEVTGQPDLVLVDRQHIIDFKTIKSVPTGWRSYVCPETERVIGEGLYALRRKWIDCPHCGLGRHEVKTIEVIHEPRAKSQHVLQLSLYRLLLHRNGIDVNTGEIVYQDMDTQRRIAVELMLIEDAERYLSERVSLARQLDLPPVLTDDDELWQCDFCPARGECERLHGGPVGKAAQSKTSNPLEEM